MTPPDSALAAVAVLYMTLMRLRICGESRWRASLNAVAAIGVGHLVAASGLALATT
jgi:hypothetical protein